MERCHCSSLWSYLGSLCVSFLEQGIATQVAGNCGFSPFGWEADTPHRALIGSGLFSLLPDAPDVHDLPGFAAACGRPPVNLLPLYGHMSGRISLAGYDPRPLTAEELEWIAWKEEQLARTGEEAGGGSLAIMLQAQRAAELTRERVYVLLEYLA